MFICKFSEFLIFAVLDGHNTVCRSEQGKDNANMIEPCSVSGLKTKIDRGKAYSKER